MKPLRDWNHNGKDDMFDYAMDKYVFDHTFGKKDETQSGKQDMTKPTKFKPTPPPPEPDKRKPIKNIHFSYIELALMIVCFIIGIRIGVAAAYKFNETYSTPYDNSAGFFFVVVTAFVGIMACGGIFTILDAILEYIWRKTHDGDNL